MENHNALDNVTSENYRLPYHRNNLTSTFKMGETYHLQNPANLETFYKQSESMIKRDLVLPGYDLEHDDKNPMMPIDTDSESDSDDSFESVSEYTTIDVNGVLGRAIAVWTYLKPDSITLFTPLPDDSLYRVVRYAEDNLAFNRRAEKIMVMGAGESNPQDMKEFLTIRPGSVVMVMPKQHLYLTAEINQLKTKFPMTADPMCTVFEVKSYIKRVKGIPLDQQDILYKDKALENSHRLYEYHVRDRTTLHVLVQVHFDLLINVETFWGKTYRLYVDRCSTGSDIIYTIFGRTFSKYGPEQVTVHELYVPVHVLTLQHHKHSIHWDYCLGYFNVRSGDTLNLSTVSRQSQMNMQVLDILTDHGKVYQITVSEFDRWSVVAFMLHGHTDIPVNLIRIYKDTVQVSFTSVVGEITRRNSIVMNMLMTSLDNDIMFGVPLKIGLGHGITETIKVLPSKKIKDVKQRLENMGVPNATMYELTQGAYKLPNAGRVKDVVHDLKTGLILKVEKYPVFIHAIDGIIYKTIVNVKHTLKHLKEKIELRSGDEMSKSRLMIAGQQYKPLDNTNMFENGISTRTSIFMESATSRETFFIMRGTILVKLKIPPQPTPDEIKRFIWDCKEIPEGSITCLQTLIFWFFRPRISKKYQLPRRKRKMKRLPAATLPLVAMSHHKSEKMEELSREAMWRHEEMAGQLKPVKMQPLRNTDQRTWPMVQDAHMTNRDIESWITTAQFEPAYDRGYPTRYRRHNAVPELRKEHDRRGKDRSKSKKLEVSHSLTPRWMTNLRQKGEANRLVVTDDDGLGYRQKPSQQGDNYSAFTFRGIPKATTDQPRHSDAFQKHLMYDNSPFAVNVEDSTDSEGSEYSQQYTRYRKH